MLYTKCEPSRTNVLAHAFFTELREKHDIDVVIRAVIRNVLTPENADDVAADIIIEGANGSTTSTASPIFAEYDIPVISDILANIGGVTVSYFEWLQDINLARGR